MKRIITGLALAAAALIAGGRAEAQQFTLVKSVISNGAASVTNGTFTMNGTVGQPAIGLVSNSTFTHGIGFWYPNVLPTGGVEVTPGYTAGGNILHQNYPNPFKGSTTIKFTLVKRAPVTLKVFNGPGQEVATLVSSDMEAGDHKVEFDAYDLPSGNYYYQLQVGAYMLRRQMVSVQ